MLPKSQLYRLACAPIFIKTNIFTVTDYPLAFYITLYYKPYPTSLTSHPIPICTNPFVIIRHFNILIPIQFSLIYGTYITFILLHPHFQFHLFLSRTNPPYILPQTLIYSFISRRSDLFLNTVHLSHSSFPQSIHTSLNPSHSFSISFILSSPPISFPLPVSYTYT